MRCPRKKINKGKREHPSTGESKAGRFWWRRLTSEWRVGTGLQVHLAVAPLAHLLGVVADVVAAVLAAAEADALLEAVGPGALEGKAHVVLVHQGVHEQVHGALVLTLHHLHEICMFRNQ